MHGIILALFLWCPCCSSYLVFCGCFCFSSCVAIVHSWFLVPLLMTQSRKMNIFLHKRLNIQPTIVGVRLLMDSCFVLPLPDFQPNIVGKLLQSLGQTHHVTRKDKIVSCRIFMCWWWRFWNCSNSVIFVSSFYN